MKPAEVLRLGSVTNTLATKTVAHVMCYVAVKITNFLKQIWATITACCVSFKQMCLRLVTNDTHVVPDSPVATALNSQGSRGLGIQGNPASDEPPAPQAIVPDSSVATALNSEGSRGLGIQGNPASDEPPASQAIVPDSSVATALNSQGSRGLGIQGNPASDEPPVSQAIVPDNPVAIALNSEGSRGLGIQGNPGVVNVGDYCNPQDAQAKVPAAPPQVPAAQTPTSSIRFQNDQAKVPAAQSVTSSIRYQDDQAKVPAAQLQLPAAPPQVRVAQAKVPAAPPKKRIEQAAVLFQEGGKVGALVENIASYLKQWAEALEKPSNPFLSVICILKLIKYLACDEVVRQYAKHPDIKALFHRPEGALDQQLFQIIRDLKAQLEDEHGDGLQDFLDALEIVGKKPEILALRNKPLSVVIENVIGIIAIQPKYMPAHTTFIAYMPERGTSMVNKMSGIFFGNLDSFVIKKIITPCVKPFFAKFSSLTPLYYVLRIFNQLTKSIISAMPLASRSVKVVPFLTILDLGISSSDLKIISKSLTDLKDKIEKERQFDLNLELGSQSRQAFAKLLKSFQEFSVKDIISSLLDVVETSGISDPSNDRDPKILMAQFFVRNIGLRAAERVNEQLLPLTIQKAVPLTVQAASYTFSLIKIVTMLFIGAVMTYFSRSSKTGSFAIDFNENITNTYKDISTGFSYGINFASTPTGASLAWIGSQGADYFKIGRQGNASVVHSEPNRTGFNPIVLPLTKPGSLAEGVLGTLGNLCSEHRVAMNELEQSLRKDNKLLPLRQRISRGACFVAIPTCALLTKTPALALSLALDLIIDIGSLPFSQSRNYTNTTSTSHTSATQLSSRMRYFSIRPEFEWIPSTYNIFLVYIGFLLYQTYSRATTVLIEDSELRNGESPKNFIVRKTANLIKNFLPEIRRVIDRNARQEVYLKASLERRVLMWLQLDELKMFS